MLGPALAAKRGAHLPQTVGLNAGSVLPLPPNALRALLLDEARHAGLTLNVLMEAGSATIIKRMLRDHLCATVLQPFVLQLLAASTDADAGGWSQHLRFPNSHSLRISMNIKNSLIGAAVASLMTITAVHAQTTSTLAAPDTKVGGEASVPNQDKGSKPMASQESRESVKAQAKSARADGSISGGEKSTMAQGTKPATPAKSTKSRAQVREEAARARKAGEIETGERSIKDKDQDKGGVKP